MADATRIATCDAVTVPIAGRRHMWWLAMLLAVQDAGALEPATTPDSEIEQVRVGPLFREPFMCAEHAEGELEFPGDALGTDCVVTGGIDPRRPEGYSRMYRSDGRSNEDWYGWGADVLAPFDGEVVRVMANDVVNEPGRFGTPPAAMLAFRRDDGVIVLYGHVADVQVAVGERVRAGQVVAKVGNNGMSRNPHIHVGALRGDTPLQIRWDLRAMGELRRREQNVAGD
jgi:murein DD-endopeptidase MepM/ murein hydrolase activator NlpD